jgi:hypothetical protein
MTNPDGVVLQSGTWQNDVLVKTPQESRRLFSTLAAYRNDPDIQRALKGASLLTFAEFADWFILGAREGQRTKNGDQYRLDDRHLSKDMLFNIAEQVCENKIGGSYGRQAMQGIAKTEGVDAVFVVAKHYEKLKREEFATRPEVALKKKMQHVLGFLIAELGECERLPTVHSVNLICTREHVAYKLYDKQGEREKARGALLMGAFLYCLKQNGERLGVLELAGGYENCGGFFSYSKMGFVKNLDLFENSCFHDVHNLPMSCDLEQFRTLDDIVGYASGVRKWTAVTDDFLRVVPRTEKEKQRQTEIARHCNLLYKLAYLQQFGKKPGSRFFSREETKLIAGRPVDAHLAVAVDLAKKTLIDDFVGKENVSTL